MNRCAKLFFGDSERLVPVGALKNYDSKQLEGYVQMSEELVPVLIVAIVFSFISFSVYLKYRTEQLRNGTGRLQEENVGLKAKTLELEGRIQVLESIVTNKNFRLEEEIDSLS